MHSQLALTQKRYYSHIYDKTRWADMTERPFESVHPPVFAEATNGTAVGLLTSAINVIEDRGETAVRVEDVAGSLGLAVTAVYRYFGSRQGLIDAAHAERVVRATSDQLAALERVVDAALTPEEFRSAFDAFILDSMSPERRSQVFVRVHALGSAYGRPELLAFLGEVHRYGVSSAARILARAQDRGWISESIDLEVVAAWFWAVTFGGVVNLVDPSPVDHEAFASLTLEALRRAVFS